MVIDIRCSYCSTNMTVNNPNMQPLNQVLKVKCPKCSNILKIKIFEDGTSYEIVHEK